MARVDVACMICVIYPVDRSDKYQWVTKFQVKLLKMRLYSNVMDIGLAGKGGTS